MRIAKLVSWVLVAAAVATVSGCGKKDDDDDSPTTSKKKGSSAFSKQARETYAETQDGVNVTTSVGGDGVARVWLTNVDGDPIKDATGTLIWKTPAGEVKKPLEREGDVLVARGPALEGDDERQVAYKLVIEQEFFPWADAP